MISGCAANKKYWIVPPLNTFGMIWFFLFSDSSNCVAVSYNAKQRNVLRNVPPAQMYVMSYAAVFVPGYLSLGGAPPMNTCPLNPTNQTPLTAVKNVGSKNVQKLEIGFSYPNQNLSWSLQICPLDELIATIGISSRYLQSPDTQIEWLAWWRVGADGSSSSGSSLLSSQHIPSHAIKHTWNCHQNMAGVPVSEPSVR